MQLAQRNASAMRAGQAAWDNAEPPEDSPNWLESSQGSDWFDDSVNSLVHGHDLRLGRQVMVSTDDLYISAEAVFMANAAELDGLQIGNMLKALQLGELDTARRCAAEILGQPTKRLGSVLADLAEELVKPHADAACAAMNAWEGEQ
jgi:hypothetical protein